MIPTTKPFIVPDSFLDAIVTDPHCLSITLLLKRWRTYVEGRESKDGKTKGRNFSHGAIPRWSLVAKLGLSATSPKKSGPAHADHSENRAFFELSRSSQTTTPRFRIVEFRVPRFKIQDRVKASTINRHASKESRPSRAGEHLPRPPGQRWYKTSNSP
jgi:hypothetical protein